MLTVAQLAEKYHVSESAVRVAVARLDIEPDKVIAHGLYGPAAQEAIAEMLIAELAPEQHAAVQAARRQAAATVE